MKNLAENIQIGDKMMEEETEQLLINMELDYTKSVNFFLNKIDYTVEEPHLTPVEIKQLLDEGFEAIPRSTKNILKKSYSINV